MTMTNTARAAFVREATRKALGLDPEGAPTLGDALINALADEPSDGNLVASALEGLADDATLAELACDGDAWALDGFVRRLKGKLLALAEVQRRIHAALVAEALGPAAQLPPAVAEIARAEPGRWKNYTIAACAALEDAGTLTTEQWTERLDAWDARLAEIRPRLLKAGAPRGKVVPLRGRKRA